MNHIQSAQAKTVPPRLMPAPSERVLKNLVVRKVLSRVAVSEPVALVIAGHAGLLREGR